MVVSTCTCDSDVAGFERLVSCSYATSRPSKMGLKPAGAGGEVMVRLSTAERHSSCVYNCTGSMASTVSPMSTSPMRELVYKK